MINKERTLTGAPVIIAPGKIFLVGEYAILERGPAVLAAVTRHAVAQFVPGLEASSRVVAQAVRHATLAIGESASALPPGSVLVRSDDFSAGGRKIGLGSSAATAVASVGAVFAAAGIPVDGHRDRLFATAYAAHQEAQNGAGSGADVATATYGGLLQVERTTMSVPAVESLPVPADLHLVVFWTGQAVSTPSMIEVMQRFARQAPATYRELIARLEEAAAQFASHIRAGRASGAVAAAGRFGQHLAALGQAASLPIFTPAFTRAADLARGLGGIAKPSGAGGGDIGVAMFAAAEPARLFVRALTLPLVAVAVDLDPMGVRRRAPGDCPPPRAGLFHA
ncbi:MAG: hypothetical protein ABSB49_07865 [Polyangia bacterium]|jgi:phosphomevalonate kinase